MSKEIIRHNNKRVTKVTKKNGDVSYSIKGVYIGTDVKTGKRITKTITAKTLKGLDRKIIETKIQFEKSGSTIKETISIDNFENLLQLLVNLLNKKGDMNQLEIMTQKEVLKELSISPNTLKSWERKGLPRLEPPIEGTRTVYYKRNDILKFLTN